jgi:hypothetical protein
MRAAPRVQRSDHEALWDQSQKASAIQSLAAPILVALHGATRPAVIGITNATQSRERIQVAESAAPMSTSE